MKKSSLQLAAFLVFALFLTSFLVSAQSSGVPVVTTNEASSVLSQWWYSNISSHVDESDWTRFFFAFLLFLVLMSVVPSIFGKNLWITIPASVVITILSIFWIPEAFLDAIRDQYGIMGAVILSVIPFIIVLIFSVRSESLLVARVVWLLYFFYYLGVYLYEIFSTGIIFSAENIPYVIALVAGLVIFLGIGSIRDLMFRGEMDSLKEAGDKVAKRGGLLHRLQKEELEDSYGGS